MPLPVVIGLVAATAVVLFGRIAKFDRSRAFYPTMLIVVASYYILFAIIGGSRQALLEELIVAFGFMALATVGHARSLGLVALGIAGHGVFDVFHGYLIENPGMPAWWPAWCASFDVAAGMGLMLLRGARSAPLAAG